MSLFQKKPVVESSAPYYTLGLDETLLLVGLGNPGKEFIGTRHNIGFDVLDSFAESEDFPEWIAKKDLKSQISIKSIGNKRIVLVKPQTFMNLSGESIQACQRFYRIDNAMTLVVHDELDIDFGSIRMRTGGKDAGHNGVKSLIKYIGSDFARLRIGVGPKQPEQIDSSNFVLAKFTDNEQKNLASLRKEGISLINEYIFSSGKLEPETRKFIL